MKTYQELSRDIDEKLDALGRIIKTYKIKEIEDRLTALENTIKALQSTYK